MPLNPKGPGIEGYVGTDTLREPPSGRVGTAPRKIRLLPLIAATFFMVSGGPYAIEDILGGAGYGRALLILLLLPIVWSLPTALMIGELASALPADGGFYVWVRRAMGPFWGFQEGWLSLTASVFDMAIYPAFVVSYLGKFNPTLTAGLRGYAWAVGVVAVCCLWNLLGAPTVGDGSVIMFVLLLAPFVVFVALGFWRGFTLHPPVQWGGPASHATLSTAILVAMWNYMGWDNASTIAPEVHEPQNTYPRAMIASTAIVALTYILPLGAMALAGLAVSSFETGDWTSAARTLGGPLLGAAIAIGGVITGIGMFNALVMSYSRLPMAMAQDGMLPRIVALRNARGVPWISVILCGMAWAMALKLPFEKLITIDLVLYGTSLVLEFAALVVLRVREPNLTRPFRAGSLTWAIALGCCPTALMGFALYAARSDEVTLGGKHISALLFALSIAAVGPLIYPWVMGRMSRGEPHI